MIVYARRRESHVHHRISLDVALKLIHSGLFYDITTPPFLGCHLTFNKNVTISNFI